MRAKSASALRYEAAKKCAPPVETQDPCQQETRISELDRCCVRCAISLRYRARESLRRLLAKRSARFSRIPSEAASRFLRRVLRRVSRPDAARKFVFRSLSRARNRRARSFRARDRESSAGCPYRKRKSRLLAQEFRRTESIEPLPPRS